MRRVALALLVACGSRTTTVIVPSAPPAEERPERPVERCAARPTDVDVNKARRDEVLSQLDKVDKELDAIDDDLESAARIDGMTINDARIAVIERKALLDKVTADAAPPDGTPRLLATALAAVLQARIEKAQLAAEYGSQHPMMKRADARIALFQKAAQAQLDAERAFARAWGEALAALPQKASPDAVYKARIGALRTSMKSAPPSESPANVRLAAERIAELEFTRAMRERDVGPKHPDMIAVNAELDDARAELARALADADAELAARIAAPPRAPDPKAIARRAELAGQARELRREYEQLLAR